MWRTAVTIKTAPSLRAKKIVLDDIIRINKAKRNLAKLFVLTSSLARLKKSVHSDEARETCISGGAVLWKLGCSLSQDFVGRKRT